MVDEEGFLDDGDYDAGFEDGQRFRDEEVATLRSQLSAAKEENAAQLAALAIPLFEILAHDGADGSQDYDAGRWVDARKAGFAALKSLPPAAARLVDIEKAARELVDDVKRRYPGEELRCPIMRRLDALTTTSESQP